MKHLSLSILIFTLLFTFSCKKKKSDPSPSDDIENSSIKVDFITVPNENLTVGGINSFYVHVITKKNIKKIELTKKLNNLSPTHYESATNAFDGVTEIYFQVTDYTIENYHTITFIAKVTDVNGKIAIKNYSFTPKANTEIITREDITLGAKDNTTIGSFYSSAKDKIFKPGEVNSSNGDSIDIVYNSASSLRYFLSPNNITNDGFAAIPNATLSKYQYIFSGITVQDFEDMTNDSLVRNQTVTENNNAFATNALYYFQNASGQKGIIHIKSYTTGSTGYVTFDLKLQKYPTPVQ